MVFKWPWKNQKLKMIHKPHPIALNQSESVGNTSKDKGRWYVIAVTIFFIRIVTKILFQPIKEHRNDKPKTIQVNLQGHLKSAWNKYHLCVAHLPWHYYEQYFTLHVYTHICCTVCLASSVIHADYTSLVNNTFLPVPFQMMRNLIWFVSALVWYWAQFCMVHTAPAWR